MKWNFIYGREVSITLAFVLMLICAFLRPSSAKALEHPHDEIIETATEFALAFHADAHSVDVTINKLDSRLRLPQCETELRSFWPQGSVKFGFSTIGIECSDPQPWKIYVRAQIDVYRQAVALAQTVNTGDVVSRENVELKMVNIATTRGDSVGDPDTLIGYRFKRRYPSGRMLALSMLSPPRLVKKGSSVVIKSATNALTVQMKGIALSDGNKGSLVNVRNSSSKRIVEGEVIAKGIVQITQ